MSAISLSLREAGVPEAARILVAVSGGVDSMALLHGLHQLGYAVGVACFDHQTRAGASAREAGFVAQTAQALKVQYYAGTAPVPQMARASGESFEQAARRLRYAFLLETARREGYPYAATGHQRDDQVETVLMRLLRGTTLNGLRGIPVVREEKGVRSLRPLLGVPRALLAPWVLDHGYGFCEDYSNANTDMFRNRVRHVLLPLLREQFNPAVDQSLLRLAEAARADEEYLDTAALKAYEEVVEESELLAAPFRELPVSLQRRVLQHWARRAGFNSTFSQTEAIRAFIEHAPTGNWGDWAEGWRLYQGRERAALHSAADAVSTESVVLPIPGEVSFYGRRYTARVVEHGSLNAQPPMPDLKRACSPTRQLFDADRAGPVLALRMRRHGDRFQPLGLAGTQKISDYFINIGLPRPQREETALLVSQAGILWVVGHAVSTLAAIGSTTARVLVVEVQDQRPDSEASPSPVGRK